MQVITSKQRAKLKSLANPMETIFQIGKSGISEATVKQVNDALTARELIKLRGAGNRPRLRPGDGTGAGRPDRL